MLGRLFMRIARFSPITVGLLAALKVSLIMGAVSLVLYVASVQAIDREVKTDLTRIAAVVAALVEHRAHQSFTQRKQESSEEYETAIAPLRRVVESSPEIAFVYTLVRRNGNYYFILDPTDAGDSDKDGVDDKSHIMQVYDDPSPSLVQTFDTGVPQSDAKPYTDMWGTFISGYAPVLDENGKVLAIAGVDLKAEKYLHRLDGVFAAARIATALGVLLSFLTGFMAYRAQSNAIAQRAMIAEREHQLQLAQEELKAQHLELANQYGKLERAITAEQAASIRMKAASQRFERLFHGIPAACFTFDSNGILFEWNNQFEQLLGLATQDLFQQSLGLIFPPDVSKIFTQFDGEPIEDVEIEVPARDGRALTLVLRAFSIEIDNQRVGGVGSLLDITERKLLAERVAKQLAEERELSDKLDDQRAQLEESNRLLEVLSTTDGLTGVNNRRSLEEHLSRHFEEAKRYGHPLSVILLDVDKFKSFNDTFGHQEGDTVLKAIASSLQGAARTADLVARYGGEEFCVILPSTGAEEAIVAAERFRKAIASESWTLRPMTASFGVVTLTHEDSTDALLRHADEALYHAKENGRNQCTHFSALASQSEESAA